MRLAIIAALLAAYPVSVGLLAWFAPPPSAAAAIDAAGSVTRLPSAAGASFFAVTVELRNGGTAAATVEQVMVTLLDGESPVSTVIEDPPAVAARSPGGRDLRAGGAMTVGPFVLAAPEAAQGDTLLVTVRVTDRGSGRAETLLLELAPPAAVP